MTTFEIPFTVLVLAFAIEVVLDDPADIESPSEREEREAAQAGQPVVLDDAVGVSADLDAFIAWIDDERERVMADFDYEQKQAGIF